MLRRPFASGLLIVAVPLSLLAQAPQSTVTPDAVVRGRVVEAAGGAALRRAQVSVTLAASAVRPVMTDDTGSFLITVPPGGAPSLRVTKAGYAPALVPPRSGGVLLEVRMTRSASIAGRVTDPAGMPVNGVQVNARRETLDASSTAPSQTSASTDIRGEYRIGGLSAGRYVVTVVQAPSLPTANRNPDALRQFSERLRDGTLEQPLTSLSTSTSLNVRAGDSIEGNDLVVDSRPPCNWAVNPPRPDATGTAVVEGRVVGPSGPLECMLVRLIQPGVVSYRSTATDANGRFSFPRLSAGTYTPQAVGWAYTQRDYGQQNEHQPGRLLTVRDGQKVDGLVIRLSPISAVTGTVHDEYGEPAEGVRIQAFEVRLVDGHQVAMDAGAGQTTTDDRGRFRLFLLLPGAYVLSASRVADVSGANAMGNLGSAPVYYPGTPDSSLAEHIRVDIGRDVDGVDVTFTPSFTAPVSGIALTPGGRPLSGSMRLVTSQRSGGVIMPARTAAIGADGTFTFASVPPGDYVVQARGRATAGDFGLERVRVLGGDPVHVAVTAFPGSIVEGRVVREGGDDIPATRFAVAPVSADFDYATTTVSRPAAVSMQADGTFRVAGLSGPARFALLTAPDGWYLKSVYIEGTNAADRPFDFGLAGKSYRDVEIVLSSAGGTVSGRVVDVRGDAVPDYSVIAYSVDRDDWFTTSAKVRLTRAEPDGTFRVSGLPPGEYWVAAVDRLDAPVAAGEWQHPDALVKLSSSAQRLRIVEKQTVNTTLRLGLRP